MYYAWLDIIIYIKALVNPFRNLHIYHYLNNRMTILEDLQWNEILTTYKLLQRTHAHVLARTRKHTQTRTHTQTHTHIYIYTGIIDNNITNKSFSMKINNTYSNTYHITQSVPELFLNIPYNFLNLFNPT